MPRRLVALALLALGSVTLGAAAAAEPSGTLRKVKESGILALGHRESSIPS